jgi:hypothetical protein
LLLNFQESAVADVGLLQHLALLRLESQLELHDLAGLIVNGLLGDLQLDIIILCLFTHLNDLFLLGIGFLLVRHCIVSNRDQIIVSHNLTALLKIPFLQKIFFLFLLFDLSKFPHHFGQICSKLGRFFLHYAFVYFFLGQLKGRDILLLVFDTVIFFSQLKVHQHLLGQLSIGLFQTLFKSVQFTLYELIASMLFIKFLFLLHDFIVVDASLMEFFQDRVVNEHHFLGFGDHLVVYVFV